MNAAFASEKLRHQFCLYSDYNSDFQSCQQFFAPFFRIVIFEQNKRVIFVFYEQLSKICQQNGTTPTGILRKIGLSTSKVTAWKNGSIPKASILQRLADELGVTTDAFFADDGPKLTEEEKELLDVFRDLSLSGKRQLLGKAYELRDAQKNTADEVAPPDVDVVAPVRGRMVNK